MSDAPANPKLFRLTPGDAFGFSGDGEREAVEWPEFNEPPEVELLGRLKEAGAKFPDEAGALEIIRADLHQQDNRANAPQIITRFIDWITTGKTVNQSGVMSHILAFIYQRSSCRTQSELADKLEITQGRVSQLINQIGEMVENIGDN
jgi:predicted XRE-type DNA-binding protein